MVYVPPLWYGYVATGRWWRRGQSGEGEKEERREEILKYKREYGETFREIHTDTENESKQTPPFNSCVSATPCNVNDSKSKRNQHTSVMKKVIK